MPNLAAHQSTETVKLLLVGNSGSGKTGALAALANAGFKLRILDYDNGLDVLRTFVEPRAYPLVDYVTLTDKLRLTGGVAVTDGPPTAYTRGVALLDEWKYTAKDGTAVNLGKLSTWGPDTVFVLDSLTRFGEAAMRFVLAISGYQGKNPEIQHWGAAMRKVEDLLAVLYSDEIRCHVVVTAHLTFQEVEGSGGIVKGYPNALGSKLPPKVATYFNNVLEVKAVGSGQHTKRAILTVPTGTVDLKNSNPIAVPPELPLITGLATFFQLVTGRRPTHTEENTK